MIIWLKRIGITIVLLFMWASVVLYSTINGWFRDAIAPNTDSASFVSAAQEIINNQYNGNIAFALIENGELKTSFGYSKGKPVNASTIFQVSSLGKWVAAFGVMALIEEGKLSLDTPVSTYLTRWQLPDSEFDNNGVTIRRLLSHTAGLTDGLGHNGFPNGTEVQPLVEHLTQAADADKGVSGIVQVGLQPGSKFKYSGGGYNLLQLIVEEVSGLAFEDYMKQRIFAPLGMNSTGYNLSQQHPRLATYYDDQGNALDYPKYTSLAATGLYTSVDDLAKFMIAHIDSAHDGDAGRGVISAHLLKQMREPVAHMMGLPIWGAGPIIFTSFKDDYVFGHDGKSPFLNTTARFNPKTGNGIIILQTGNQTLATDVASEWTFWETGKRDLIMLKNSTGSMVKVSLIGWVIIIIAGLFRLFMTRKKRKQL